MSENSGADYVAKMRDKGMNDEEIKAKMLAAGWNSIEVNQAFTPPDPDAPPPPPSAQAQAHNIYPDGKPVAVVENLSTRGIEYAIMFIALGIGAFNLGSLLHLMVATAFDPNSSGSAEMYAFPATAALVTIPIFLFLFSRLKAAESEDPDLRKDASRRKWVQFTLLASFLIGIGYIIYFLYAIFSANTVGRYSDDDVSAFNYGSFIFQQIIHLCITLGIAGSIFFYWWHDEHKKDEPEA